MTKPKFTFSRDDLFGNEMITQSSHPKNSEERISPVGRLKYRGYRERSETEELIKSVLKEAKKPVKFRDVARGIDRSPNPFLRQILAEMVEAGQIVQTQDIAPNDVMPRYWYALPKNSRS